MTAEGASIAFLLERFEEYGDTAAIVWNDTPYSFAKLRQRTLHWRTALESEEIGPVVALSADYSPESISILLALLEKGRIVAPLTAGFDKQKDEFFEIAQVATEIALDDDDQATIRQVGHTMDHPLLQGLETAGFVLFSSGATGKSKAVVHDGQRLLDKYRTPRRGTVTIPFMLFDHIGGVNTVFHVLSSGGTAVIAQNRNPKTICRLIEAHKVKVMPTSPTFINLLLLSDFDSYDLSSLEILAYGAERMPQGTLDRLNDAFPNVKLVQNYGLSEVGIMRTKSESSGSLWVKLGGDGFETRVRDGLLEIKSATAMVGYLNAPSPFTDDGWLKTGDRVETKGEYFRILGRQSDIIIIGGEKVYPAEVEDSIAAMPGVVDVVVSSESNAITGQIVKAQVRLSTDEKRSAFRKRMNEFLATRLAPFKIPQKVTLTKEPLHNTRFKKARI